MDPDENEPFSKHVYIGFSAKDVTYVKILQAQLERNNVSCYLRGTKDDTLTSIKEGVKTCKKCLLFITSAYLEDGWYNMERPYVLEKVELFSRDTLIIVKNESSQSVPNEYQGGKEAVITKEKLNDENAIKSLVAAIIKGMAISIHTWVLLITSGFFLCLMSVFCIYLWAQHSRGIYYGITL